MKKLILPITLLILGSGLLGWSFMEAPTTGDLDVEIVKKEAVMPAAHNVYANPNVLDGKYYFFKSKLTNNTNKTLEDVTVRYRIPGYIDWTELDVIGEMKVGQTASVCCYPKFKDEICDKMTESVEKAEIEITWDGAGGDDIIEEEFGFKITDRNEFKFTDVPKEEIAGWADVHSNDALLACYVTPNDPIVKYYTQNIQEKILMGEAASVNRDPKEALRFLTGIYDATLASHMVYSSTKMIPENLTDITKFSQHNRLPREVITGNTGLCLELSLLYASVMSSAGIDPVIYLVPGHAYPGFRMNGQYFAIEATGIGGEGLGSIASAQQALEVGQKSINEFIQKSQAGDPRYTIVDIHALNQEGVTPMALKDDEFLRKKVDDIVATWSGKSPAKTGAVVANNNSGNYVPPTNPQPRPSATRSLSFNPPSGWQTQMYPVPDMPILTATSSSPDMMTSASVYDVPTNNSNEALNAITTYLSYYGMDVQYQVNGNSVSGITYSTNGNFAWVGKILHTAGGLRIVTIGTVEQMYQQQSSLINQVYNSIN